jgi:hypothetical protein
VPTVAAVNGYAMPLHVAPPAVARPLRRVELTAELCVVGGGLAGLCAALTAARAGARVVLVQDRPVLGGNASSEVRLWGLGATVHMLTNNRWAREGGVINEILLDNLHRNPEGNPLIFDTILLEKAAEEPHLTLLLNTAAHSVTKAADAPDRIAGVEAFCAQNSTHYHITAPLFCDASGDGIMGFLSGAAFRMGAEPRLEFDEAFAPTGDFGHLLGHSIYFYTKDTGRPVTFTPPSFALKNTPGTIPRHRAFNTREQGCQLWWIEYGGRLDTVHDTETIKWELWRVVYGVWDYIKNSGKHTESANLTLEWVGTIPGKRESRRFEGDHLLTQHDVIERHRHPDDVSYGGWSIDLHPADGVFAEIAGSHHLYSKGIYPIPYRCLYSRNVSNLFLAGRIISASHVAFGSTRVMLTGAHGGQAVGLAAAHCARDGLRPRDLLTDDRMARLQRDLLRTGQFIPGRSLHDPADLVAGGQIDVSSTLQLAELPPGGPVIELQQAQAQMLPVNAGRVPAMTVMVDVMQPTTLTARLLSTSDPWHHCPDVELARMDLALTVGERQAARLDFAPVELPEARYVFWVLEPNPAIRLHLSPQRLTGVLRLRRTGCEQQSDRGGESFDVYAPERRPGGQNLACRLEPPLAAFTAEHLRNGIERPTHQANAWVAALTDPSPTLTVRWTDPTTLGRVELAFDVDYDHAMESAQWGHPERTVPFCVRDFSLIDAAGRVVHTTTDNHQARVSVSFDPPVVTTQLALRITAMADPLVPAAVFALRAYGP